MTIAVTDILTTELSLPLKCLKRREFFVVIKLYDDGLPTLHVYYVTKKCRVYRTDSSTTGYLPTFSELWVYTALN